MIYGESFFKFSSIAPQHSVFFLMRSHYCRHGVPIRPSISYLFLSFFFLKKSETHSRSPTFLVSCLRFFFTIHFQCTLALIYSFFVFYSFTFYQPYYFAPAHSDFHHLLKIYERGLILPLLKVVLSLPSATERFSFSLSSIRCIRLLIFRSLL